MSATPALALRAEPLAVPKAESFKVDRRLPVAGQVYAALRSDIISLRFPPGASISENVLCRRYGVSRTPVRSAIQELSDEGLVEVFPNRGSYVAPIRLSALQDSHFIRLSVEVALLRDVLAHWSPQNSAIAHGSVRAQRAAVLQGDDAAAHIEDERFHKLLSVFAGRPGVWPTIAACTTRLMRFMRLCGTPDRLPITVSEHEAVIVALDKGDLAAAEDALAFHISRNFSLVDALRERHASYFDD